MTTVHRTAAIAVLAASTPTHADGRLQGTATWLYDVTTQNGDAIVEPGETASITLSLLMEPNDPDDYVAIAVTIFDTIGGDGADMGFILGWEVLNYLDQLTGDLTTTDGVSLYNTNAGQLTVFTGPFTGANPVDVLTFEWAPHEYVHFDVNYATISDIEGQQIVVVWEGENWDVVTAVDYPVTEAAISFAVVPAPPAALALLLATAITRRRSR